MYNALLRDVDDAARAKILGGNLARIFALKP
jgi:hypothetical protein